MIKPKFKYLFEASYEVCNERGGVYRVLESKAYKMNEIFGKNYLAIGYYNQKTVKVMFESSVCDSTIKDIFDELKKEGIICYYGHWLVEGKPNVILLDTNKFSKRLSLISKEIKNSFGFEIITGEEYFDKTFVWGYAVGMLLERIIKLEKYSNSSVVHLHTWDSLVAAYYLNMMKCNIPIVFTTHDTAIGRKIILNKDTDFYKKIYKAIKEKTTVRISSVKNLRKLHHVLHQLQKNSTKVVSIFTTVGEIVGLESQYILGKKPDIITPNGLEETQLVNLELRTLSHLRSKERLYKFISAYFLPYYEINITDALLFFTAGRYEMFTKGYDLFIDALGKLNQKLKKENFRKNIFVFFLIFKDKKIINTEVLENLSVYAEIEQKITEATPTIKNRIISSLIHGHGIEKETIFDEHLLMDMRKLMFKFKRNKVHNPPLCAFKMNDKNDLILKLFKKNKLENNKEDNIKVIFYPAPVSIADGLLGMHYYSVLSGMQLGIFPSFYEPWGYTPHETVAHGVPTVTTDVTGFGRFIKKEIKNPAKHGIFILNREKKSYEESLNGLINILNSYAKLNKEERIKLKTKAIASARLASWGNFIKYYIKAENMAFKKRYN